MKNGDNVIALCSKCHGKRNHEVLHNIKTQGPVNDYHYVNYDAIIRCKGCDEISFLSEFHDLEVSYQIGPNEWDHEISQTRYPQIIENFNEIEDYSSVPNIVRQIYKETIDAIKMRSFIIAGAGMRAVIESICNERSITGKDLKVRINKLHTQGIIAKEDAKRLHAIRFMGNDAVHEIKPAKKDELLLALKIINHIIETIYVLSEASDLIDTTIETYEELKTLVNRSKQKIKSGTILTLKGILGKSTRRVEDIDTLEAQFVIDVQANQIHEISLETNQDQNGKYLYKVN